MLADASMFVWNIEEDKCKSFQPNWKLSGIVVAWVAQVALKMLKSGFYGPGRDRVLMTQQWTDCRALQTGKFIFPYCCIVILSHIVILDSLYFQGSISNVFSASWTYYWLCCVLGKGAQKKPGKMWSFAKLPSDPPPVWHFYEKYKISMCFLAIFRPFLTLFKTPK